VERVVVADIGIGLIGIPVASTIMARRSTISPASSSRDPAWAPRAIAPSLALTVRKARLRDEASRQTIERAGPH
jgi:hypothetical protein